MSFHQCLSCAGTLLQKAFVMASNWVILGNYIYLLVYDETSVALKSHVNALPSVFKCHNKVSRRLKTSQEVCLLNVNHPAHKLHYLGFSQERFKLLSHFMSR